MSEQQSDRVWKALSDRTRRRMLDLLVEKPMTTGELAGAFPKLSRFAVMKHMRVLQRAGMLVVTRNGREKINSLNSIPLVKVLRRWVGKYRQFWADSFLDIAERAESIARDEQAKG